jgi:hypothetical protein
MSSDERAALNRAMEYARLSGFYGTDPKQVEFSIREQALMSLAIAAYARKYDTDTAIARMVEDHKGETNGNTSR